MNESYITVHGYVVATPVIRKVGEHDVANFRIGVTPRKLERSSGEWRDAETQWYAVSAWRALGVNVARSLRRGDPVIVQGRLSARTWVNAQHAEVVAHDIEATVVGHDLRRGVTTFAKTAPEVPAASEETSRAETPSAHVSRPLTPPDLQELIEGPGDDADGATAPAPGQTATRSDWSAPMQSAPTESAPDWAGAA